MGNQHDQRRFSLSRRDFLKHSLAAGTAVWAGALPPAGSPVGPDEAQALLKVKEPKPSLFPQSVASGDPRPNGIVLWTRIETQSTRKLKVGWQIAGDPTFKRQSIVLSGAAQTDAESDYTVKVPLTSPELTPFTTYFYRFIFSNASSQTGRFKTLPAPDAQLERLRFGTISCQDYTNGYYTALGHLAGEEIDFVVHLGDYIYETVDEASFQGGGPADRRITLPQSGDAGEADTLTDYRFLYKTYRSDPNLQKAHENFAFITVWDDHEFANDAHQVNAPDADGEKVDPPRREAANRAWAEYTPSAAGFDPAQGPLEEIALYQSLAFGNLLELVMTDERLYRDGPPCGNATPQRYFTPGCGAEEAPGRSMLGASQKAVLVNKLTTSPRTWKIWGNEVQFGQFKVSNTYLGDAVGSLFPSVPPSPTGSVYVTLDNWDGYRAERRDITRAVKNSGVRNFVVITGDIHTFIANYIKENYDDLLESPVGVEFVCGSVTSSNLTEIATFGQGADAVPRPAVAHDVFSAAVRTSNPHYVYFNSDSHGYNLIEVTPQNLVCTMVGVSTIRNPSASKTVLKRFRVPEGQVQILDETPVVPL